MLRQMIFIFIYVLLPSEGIILTINSCYL